MKGHQSLIQSEKNHLHYFHLLLKDDQSRVDPKRNLSREERMVICYFHGKNFPSKFCPTEAMDLKLANYPL